MADAPGGHPHSATWFNTSEYRPSNIPSNRTTTTGSLPSLSHDHNKTFTASKSRRTLRQSSVISDRKAYPLPVPSQIENQGSGVLPLSLSSSSSDPTDDILYPVQSYKRFAEREREIAKPSPPVVTPVVTNPQDDKQPASALVMLKLPSPPDVTPVVTNPQDDKQPASALVTLKLPSPPDKLPATATEPVLESFPEEVPAKGNRSKVVIVHDAEKKFTTGAVDVALGEFATAEGDVIMVVAFLEHIMSPMGMKMVADLKQFSGVNQSIIKQSILLQKNAIESKLRETGRMQLCETKKIQLDVKVLPGSNSRALIAKEIIDFQTTCAIFDKNAMKNRKYYEDNLSCRVLRLRSDGRRVETICLFGQGPVADKTGCTLSSQCSDSSSDSGSGSMNSDSPTIWSKLFGSRRSTGSLRHSPSSGMGSNSRTSSNLGSPRPLVQEEDEAVAEELEKSFSFDSPIPNPAAEALVYTAAGFDHKFVSYVRNRNGESSNLPTALAA